MNFQESVDYLYGLGYELSVKKFGLENTFALLAALGNPENNYLKIQIAGTNGKGSTCAFLESILNAAGIQNGKYTSPHLVSITERISVNGRDISEEEFAVYATRIRETSEKLVEEKKLPTVPTFFEQVTAIALAYFADRKIDVAVLETGLGGRFDATTAARAEIAAITPIDYDHQNILGETLTEIAAEKAAIIRSDSKVVVAKQEPESLAVILDQCRKNHVVPILENCRLVEENPNELFFITKNKSYFIDRLGLAGDHQFDNACTAISVAEILNDDCKFGISDLNIKNGLETARHKGRLEWLEAGNTRILFDGAHNASGAEALKKYIEKYHPQSKITMVFGSMKDKDLTEISELLFPLAENLILTEPDNPRAEKTEGLRKYAEKVVAESKIFTAANVSDAVDSAIQMTSTYPPTHPGFVCVTGSLYLIGEAQKTLKNHFSNLKFEI